MESLEEFDTELLKDKDICNILSQWRNLEIFCGLFKIGNVSKENLQIYSQILKEPDKYDSTIFTCLMDNPELKNIKRIADIEVNGEKIYNSNIIGSFQNIDPKEVPTLLKKAEAAAKEGKNIISEILELDQDGTYIDIKDFAS